MCKNLSQFILEQTLPLNRQGEQIEKFLKKHFDSYINRLHEIIQTTNHNDFPHEFYDFIYNEALPIIIRESELLIKIISSQPNDIHKKEDFDALMTYLQSQNFPVLRVITPSCPMVRLRGSDQDTKMERKDLFHIPMTLKQYASSQRYSMLGNPSLYLTASYRSIITGGLEDNTQLCWLECGMPLEFNVSIFMPQRNLNLLHFGENFYTYLDNYKESNDPIHKKECLISISQYIMSYPLRAACSVQVNNKDVPYIQEYVIPQLLLSWVSNNKSYDGIAYQSASRLQSLSKHKSINVVLPAKNIDVNDGFCSDLKKLFKITTPQHISIVDRFLEKESDIKKIAEYTEQLQNKLYSNGANLLHPYRNILSICNLFLHTYSIIIDKNAKNAETSFHILESLCLFSLHLVRSIKMASSAEEWVSTYRTIKAETLSSSDMDEILLKFLELNSIFQKVYNDPFPPLSNAGFFEISNLDYL